MPRIRRAADIELPMTVANIVIKIAVMVYQARGGSRLSPTARLPTFFLGRRLSPCGLPSTLCGKPRYRSSFPDSDGRGRTSGGREFAALD